MKKNFFKGRLKQVGELPGRVRKLKPRFSSIKLFVIGPAPDGATGRIAQKAVEEAGKQFSYAVGNATESALQTAANNTMAVAETGKKIARGAASAECARAFGLNTFKGVMDYTDGDKLCTGLCAAAAACELVAFTSCVIPYPGAYKVFMCAKGGSISCMQFRDRCRELQGKKLPGC